MELALYQHFHLSSRIRKYKTLISQEMLKHGFLASTSVYVCTEHHEPILENYFEQMDKVFKLIAECECGRNIDDLLKGQSVKVLKIKLIGGY